MSATGTDPSRSEESAGHTLDLGRVDELRIRVSYARMLDGPAFNVFFLDVHPTTAPDERFDEMPYLDALGPLVHVGGAPLPYSVHVNRTHSTRGTGAGEVDIVVALTMRGYSTALGRVSVDAVRGCFRRILEYVGGLPTALPTRTEAITEARLRVEYAYPDVHADHLAVTNEEHRPNRSWSVGLMTPDLTRFQVVLGFAEGAPGTAHIRRITRSEVVDSVGTDGDG